MWNRRLREGWMIGLVVIVMVSASRGVAQDAKVWRVGLAKADVTPLQPMLLSGYAGRREPFTRIDHRLYAKAIAIEDHQGNRALLITADIIGFPATVTEPICEKIMKETGLRRDQIMLNASHTHSGPIVTRDLRMDMPDEQRRRINENTDRLEKRVVQIGVEAWKDMRPARLAWGRGVAHFAMNRREFTDRGVRLGVNPAGPADRSVPVIRVTNPDGSLRAAV
ncbi:MAG: neutral/alkaline non-lysosomal ceramidase N-terminal domain-containing protein, partial [Planctomycetota bacterium]